MDKINYEAWHKSNTHDDEQIYNGFSKKEMILEIRDYIEYHKGIDESQITEQEIEELNEKALKKIGIKLYFTKW